MITPDYIAGFTDGEGCFSLIYRKDTKIRESRLKTYFSWKAKFVICLKADDANILEQIKQAFGCGKIHFLNSTCSVIYSVNDLKDLWNIFVPFFRTNSLIGKKGKDFKLWARAVEILHNENRIAMTDRNQNTLLELKNIHQMMGQFKSKGRGAKWLV